MDTVSVFASFIRQVNPEADSKSRVCSSSAPTLTRTLPQTHTSSTTIREQRQPDRQPDRQPLARRADGNWVSVSRLDPDTTDPPILCSAKGGLSASAASSARTTSRDSGISAISRKPLASEDIETWSGQYERDGQLGISSASFAPRY